MPIPDDGDLIGALQAKLRKYPHVRYEATPYEIHILPLSDEGFGIRIVLYEHWYSVWCEGWYKQFQTAADALAFVESALTESSRLEVWVRGKTPYKWIFQRHSERGWETVGARSSIVRPFWRRRRVLQLQNRILEAA